MSKTEELVSYTIRLTRSQRKHLLERGGIKWLRTELNEKLIKNYLTEAKQKYGDIHHVDKKSHGHNFRKTVTESDLIRIHLMISNTMNKINYELSRQETDYFNIREYCKGVQEALEAYKFNDRY